MKKVYIQPFTYCHIINVESQILAGTQKGDATTDFGGGSDGTQDHNGNGNGEGVTGTGGDTNPNDWDMG